MKMFLEHQQEKYPNFKYSNTWPWSMQYVKDLCVSFLMWYGTSWEQIATPGLIESTYNESIRVELSDYCKGMRFVFLWPTMKKILKINWAWQCAVANIFKKSRVSDDKINERID
jgi:hypothetical protein